ncbi:MAG: hypothetical protein ACF8SC_08585 [Phycisphaerales bacterium JB037]
MRARRGAVSAWVLLVVMALAAVGLWHVQEGAKAAARETAIRAAEEKKERAWAARVEALAHPRFDDRMVEFVADATPFGEEARHVQQWSALTGPEGTFLIHAYVRGEPWSDLRQVLLRFDPDSGHLERLLSYSRDQGSFGSASVSFEGERVAWTSLFRESSEVYTVVQVLDLKSGLLRSIGSPEWNGWLIAPVIDAAGERIAGLYRTAREDGAVLIRIAGIDIQTEEEWLLPEPERLSTSFSWVPGRSFVIADGGRTGVNPHEDYMARARRYSEIEGDHAIWMVPLDGFLPTLLSGDPADLRSLSSRADRGAHTSADGRFIVLEEHANAAFPDGRLALLDIETGERTTLAMDRYLSSRGVWHPTEPILGFAEDRAEEFGGKQVSAVAYCTLDVRTMEKRVLLVRPRAAKPWIRQSVLWRIGDDSLHVQGEHALYRIAGGALESVFEIPERLREWD